MDLSPSPGSCGNTDKFYTIKTNAACFEEPGDADLRKGMTGPDGFPILPLTFWDHLQQTKKLSSSSPPSQGLNKKDDHNTLASSFQDLCIGPSLSDQIKKLKLTCSSSEPQTHPSTTPKPPSFLTLQKFHPPHSSLPCSAGNAESDSKKVLEGPAVAKEAPSTLDFPSLKEAPSSFAVHKKF